jgi:hypothetical protein
VNAGGGLISAIAAVTALRRQRRDAALTGPATPDGERPRVWTPQDGPAWDERGRRQNRL